MKKSQSAIIATVILILIVVAASVIVMGIIIPLIKDQLSGSSCLNIIGEITIRNDVRYTCFKQVSGENNDEVRIQIHIGDINESISGFEVGLSGGGSSKIYKIKRGSVKADKIGMYLKRDIDPIEIPGSNEERTYNLTWEGKPETITLYADLINGKTCNVPDTFTSIKDCSS